MDLDYIHGLIAVNKSDPSPFQVRQYFDQHKLKELGESIQREGLIEPMLMDICQEVRTVSIQHGLNRSQTRALETLKAISYEEFHRVTAPVRQSSHPVMGPGSIDASPWEITHLIDCPLSTQRFLPHMVRSMQKNRTLGVVRRSLVIGRKRYSSGRKRGVVWGGRKPKR